jgi:hypothetical protein
MHELYCCVHYVQPVVLHQAMTVSAMCGDSVRESPEEHCLCMHKPARQLALCSHDCAVLAVQSYLQHNALHQPFRAPGHA